MKIDYSTQSIIIDDPTVYSCLTREGNEHLRSMYDGILKTLCATCEQTRDSSVSSCGDRNILETLVSLITRSTCELQSKLDTFPSSSLFCDSLDELKSIVSDSHSTDDIVSRLQSHISTYSDMSSIRSMIDDKYHIQSLQLSEQLSSLKSQVSALTPTVSSINDLGKDGELFLLSTLQDELSSRDGFTVVDVHGESKSCDIRVHHISHDDIYIESKNYLSGKVATRDVDKFVRDLTFLNSHGIFVSLKSGIVGKQLIQIDRLSNGKFAVYLSSIGSNLELVPEIIRLLHYLDDLNMNLDSSLHQDIFEEITDYISTVNTSLKSLKHHLSSSMKILNKIDLTTITSIIDRSSRPVKPEEKLNIIKEVCGDCNREFASKSGLSRHKCSAVNDKYQNLS
jgi:hypothetical protein